MKAPEALQEVHSARLHLQTRPSKLEHIPTSVPFPPKQLDQSLASATAGKYLKVGEKHRTI